MRYAWSAVSRTRFASFEPGQRISRPLPGSVSAPAAAGAPARPSGRPRWVPAGPRSSTRARPSTCRRSSATTDRGTGEPRLSAKLANQVQTPNMVRLTQARSQPCDTPGRPSVEPGSRVSNPGSAFRDHFPVRFVNLVREFRGDSGEVRAHFLPAIRDHFLVPELARCLSVQARGKEAGALSGLECSPNTTRSEALSTPSAGLLSFAQGSSTRTRMRHGFAGPQTASVSSSGRKPSAA